VIAAGARARSGAAVPWLSSVDTSVCSWDSLVSASPCRGHGGAIRRRGFHGGAVLWSFAASVCQLEFLLNMF